MDLVNELLYDCAIFLPEIYKSRPGRPSKYGPGQFLAMRMNNNPELKRQVQALKSSDIADIRPDLWHLFISEEDGRIWDAKQRFSQLKLDFDKTMKR